MAWFCWICSYEWCAEILKQSVRAFPGKILGGGTGRTLMIILWVGGVQHNSFWLVVGSDGIFFLLVVGILINSVLWVGGGGHVVGLFILMTWFTDPPTVDLPFWKKKSTSHFIFIRGGGGRDQCQQKAKKNKINKQLTLGLK